MVVYSVYLFDRATSGAEDEINRRHLKASMKNLGILVSLAAFSLGIFLSSCIVACFVPYLIGFAYSRGIHAGNLTLKLKGGKGVKKHRSSSDLGSNYSAFHNGLDKKPRASSGNFCILFHQKFYKYSYLRLQRH
jgi:hypothetical protein